VDIEAVNLVDRVIHMRDGSSLPIVKMFDEDRDETDDYAEAVSVVFGMGDAWGVLMLDECEPAAIQ